MKAEKAEQVQDAVKEAKRAYYRAWAKKNPDKVKANRQRFFERLAMKNAGAKEAGTVGSGQ